MGTAESPSSVQQSEGLHEIPAPALRRGDCALQVTRSWMAHVTAHPCPVHITPARPWAVPGLRSAAGAGPRWNDSHTHVGTVPGEAWQRAQDWHSVWDQNILSAPGCKQAPASSPGNRPLCSVNPSAPGPQALGSTSLSLPPLLLVIALPLGQCRAGPEQQPMPGQDTTSLLSDQPMPAKTVAV
ncbi:hypothetical protein KIL84_014828 [Mauremys mutica]|uniref:Uncharacterized protein n=1 Tax=Mauremys mutica TaxID=74926 RepID=A0A9D4B142_9SAUR|nr:hypothetical protein KIL84_014828 [Mauremys mutica]